MAFQLGDDDQVGMSEINLIPLIDIMLVLMIIFLVTATVLNPTIPLTLPKTSATINDQPAKIIAVSIDKESNIYIDKKAVSIEALATELTAVKDESASQEGSKLPSINIRADEKATYDAIAKVLATASNTGLTDIAFVSDSQ